VDSDAHALAATGERTAPGLPDEEYWFARHQVAYRWIARWLATRLAPGRVVVDAGAGEGYGAALLADAGTVVALEYDDVACAHMRRTYAGVTAVKANLAALPLRPAAVDAITCLQVVEHLWDLRHFLRDCRRALREGGWLIVTTPQRLTFSPGLDRGEKPINPFHVEEFDDVQLHQMLLDAGFETVEMRGVHHGPRLSLWEAEHGSIITAQVQAALSGTWPSAVRAMVQEVTPDDFIVDAHPVPIARTHIASAQDLLAIAQVAP
jgi:SAM-dependent methyltransferase